MHYEYSSKELYDSYDQAETSILKAHQRKLLQDRADRGNTAAKSFIKLIVAQDNCRNAKEDAANVSTNGGV